MLKQGCIKCLQATALVAVIAATGSFSYADDAKPDIDALKAQLAEAERLLEADKASHDSTAEKKREIDERLAQRKKREAEIFEEMKQLCEDQEKLTPGTVDDCMAKLSN